MPLFHVQFNRKGIVSVVAPDDHAAVVLACVKFPVRFTEDLHISVCEAPSDDPVWTIDDVGFLLEFLRGRGCKVTTILHVQLPTAG